MHTIQAVNCQKGQEVRGIVVTLDSNAFLILRPDVSKCVHMFVLFLISPWCIEDHLLLCINTCTQTCRVCLVSTHLIVQYTRIGCCCDVVLRCVCVCEAAAPYKAADRYRPLKHWVEIMQKRSWHREGETLPHCSPVCSLEHNSIS